MTPRIRFFVGALLALSGCARPVAPAMGEPDDASRNVRPVAVVRVRGAELAEPKPPVAPSETPPPPAESLSEFRKPIPVCRGGSKHCDDAQVCVGLDGDAGGQYCAPLIKSEQLYDKKLWSVPVVVEMPEVGIRDRGLRCKSIPCGYPVATLEVPQKPSLALVLGVSMARPPSTVIVCWTANDPPTMPPGKHGWACQGQGSLRMLGVVRPYFESGRSEPRLEFEVLAADPAPGW